MSSRKAISNISANSHFFENLFSWLQETFASKLSEVKIFLPNRRSCRMMTELFLEKRSATILPKIKAISDISYDDFFDLTATKQQKDVVDKVLQIKVLSHFDYLFLLAAEIQKMSLFYENGRQIEFYHALKLAMRFKEIFDEIEQNEVGLEALQNIDESQLAIHRQINLDFIKNFYIQLKNLLIKGNMMSQSSYHNFIVENFAKLLSQQGSPKPIVIAGSTGSLLKTRQLIKVVHDLENGDVVLHGYVHQNDKTRENHAQFFLNQLTDFLQISETEISDIFDENFLLSDNERQKFIAMTMLSSDDAVSWQSCNASLDKKKISADLLQNFCLIEAPNKLTEAKIIAETLQKSVQQNQRAALIVNDEALAEFVQVELKNLQIPFNDTRSQKVSNLPLMRFLLAIIDVVESDFNSHSLAALIKSPFYFSSQSSEIVEKFEREVLRNQRLKPGISGLKQKVITLNNVELVTFFDKVCQNLEALTAKKESSSLSGWIAALTSSVEASSGKRFSQLLSGENASEEIQEFFTALQSKKNIDVKVDEFGAVFRALLSQVSYFEKSLAMAPIQLLTAIEARLLNFDLVIISSLSDGDFPSRETEDWLGKKIKKDLGINRAAQKYGQAAHDFWMYVANTKIVLSRSLSDGRQFTTPSPFLLKLLTLCKKLQIEIPLVSAPEKKYEVSINFVGKAPEPKPEISLRPEKLSITEISKLRANPYAIYAKKILQLKEVSQIDFEGSYAEFGSFVHKALEEFIKNPKQQNFLKKCEEIFNEFFPEESAKLIWLPKFFKIFAEFEQENELFCNLQNHVEIPVKLRVGEALITGKIDRITISSEGEVEIFDYKTGQISSKKNVQSGIDPQLTIAALALVEGVIENKISNIAADKIFALNYWKLSASSEGGVKKIVEGNEEITILLAAAKEGISRLFNHFRDLQNGYIATANDEKTEYKNLIRLEEWN